jgi:hypothetical protein
MKQNKKAKICFVICFAGKKKLLFYIYAVIVKQNLYKRSSKYYSYASGEDVLPVGTQALGISHACHHHSPSRVRNAGTTTTNVDSHTGNKGKIF